MAGINPDPSPGESEIIDITYDDIMYLNIPYVINGTIRGQGNSTHIKVYINNTIIRTIPIINHNFTFEYINTNKSTIGSTLTMTFVGVNNENEEDTDAIYSCSVIVKRPSLAWSVAQMYLVLKQSLSKFGIDESLFSFYKSNMTINDNRWTPSGQVTIRYDNNGCTVNGTAMSDIYYTLNTNNLNITTPFVAEFDIVAYTLGYSNDSTEFIVHNAKLLFENSKLQLRPTNNNDNNVAIKNTFTLPLHIKIKVETNTITVYVDDILFGSVSTNSNYQNIQYKTYNNRSLTIKNLFIYKDNSEHNENNNSYGLSSLLDKAEGL